LISLNLNYPPLTGDDNRIISLPGQPGDVLSPILSLVKGVIIMSTYEEFMVILTVGLLIVGILNLKNKK
jgi:hypothetical protein